MILYIEKDQRSNKYTQSIIKYFPQAQVLWIDNFKNIFDIDIVWETETDFIIAWVSNPIIQAPLFYGYPGKGFFLKNSLNCVYNCKYCYLQWIFKNDKNTIFVNYEDIKKEVKNTLSTIKIHTPTWFYSSDYSDNLALDHITNFTAEFVPFFDSLDGAKMEIRTKSSNIGWLMALPPSKNVEIAFSLSPQEIISLYETWTPWLTERLKTISVLLEKWWQVGIRLMPLIACDNYKEVYNNFLDQLEWSIEFSQIYSIFIGGLLFTESDYKTLLKKQSHMQILYHMSLEEDWFYRQSREVRERFYDTFSQRIWSKAKVCFDVF